MRSGTVLIAALVIAWAMPAAAQGTASRSASGDTRPLVGAGLSFLTDGSETGTGFIVDLSKPFGSFSGMSIGGVGDFGWHFFRTDGYRSMTFMGGTRMTWAGSARFAPFGQFLLGGVRFNTSFCEDCSETHLAFGPGGGVDVSVTNRFKIRGQVDFLFINYGDDEDAGHATRFTFGVSLPIGR
jgi:hypothetical protein